MLFVFCFLCLCVLLCVVAVCWCVLFCVVVVCFYVVVLLLLRVCVCVCVWWVCSRLLRRPSAGPPSAGPPSAGPPSTGPPKISLFFFPSPATIFILFSLSCWSFSLNFGGVFEDRDPQIYTFGLSGCRVKPRRPHQTRGPHFFWVWPPTLCGPTMTPKIGQNWIGQNWLWPKLAGPKPRWPKMDWPKLDWPKLVKSGWPKRDWPKSVPSLGPCQFELGQFE